MYNSYGEVTTGPNEGRPEVEDSPLELEDEQLVTLAQSGEHWPVDELVRRYQGKTYAIAYNLCSGDTEEAKDLTQEALIRAFRKLRGFRGESSFYTWLYRIVVNTSLDGRRRRRRRERIISLVRARQDQSEHLEASLERMANPEGDTNPMEVLSGKELARRIRSSLKSLPEKQQVAFKLKVLHGMSIREVAQVMGVAEGTIKSHLFRATRFLQKALEDWI